MTSEYSLSEGSIVINEENIIWSADAEVNSVQYIINENSLSNNTLNEAYVTATDDSSQYFSVLETSSDNDVTLEDLHNLSLESSKSAFLDNLIIAEDISVDSKETEESDTDTLNVVVFKIDEDIYGIQAAEDEHGNLQKYKFKFRTTEDGQLEAIPESVELVSTDELSEINDEATTDSTEICNDENLNEPENDNVMNFQIEEAQDHIEDGTNIYIKGEVNSETDDADEANVDFYETKELYIEETCQNKAVNMKEEIIKDSRTTAYPESDTNTSVLEVLAYSPMEEESLPSPNIEVNHNQPEIYENGGTHHNITDELCSEEYVDSKDEHTQMKTCVADFDENIYEQDLDEICQINEEIVVSNDQSEQSPDESQTDDDEFVEEIYIEENQDASSECTYNGTSEQQDIVSCDKPSKQQPNSNPRSILKSSFATSAVSQGLRPIKRVETDCHVFSCMDEIYQNKRFARNRDLQQVKKFHHFLNRTTVPEAPVRKSRLPRKQRITASCREDNEIIVQEVLVSSNGIVGPLHDMLQKNFNVAVTAVVELSDSDDDANSSSKRKLCQRDTSDSRSRSESEASVVEIYPVDENIENKPLDASKRPRGRPRKSEVKGRPPSINPILLNPGKKEIRCPYCPKTFPSQNSMNTHIHHHNLENSLRNARTTHAKPRPSLLPSLEYNHKCQDCEQTFKNSILLQRHTCPKNNIMHSCTHCSKKFADVILFNMHKKSHVKASLVKNTSSAIVSPKKSKTASAGVFRSPQKSVFKSPKKISKLREFRCQDCLKLCSSDANLKIHQKTHKKFTCNSCSAPFSSKILLDSHVRLNCVKVRSFSNKRLSLKIRKSFGNSPVRRMPVAKSKIAENALKKDITLNQSTKMLFDLECEICQKHFSTHRNLFTHKVQKHGFNTLDKSVTAKPKGDVLYKAKLVHGGVPTNDRMKRAFLALRKKLAASAVHVQTSNISTS